MSTFLRRSCKYKSQWIYYKQYRTYFTGSRYSGYVNFFHNENLFGFVVREDAPEREYYFHVTDLHAENIPRVRPLQPVEFSIIEGRGGNFMARDISAPGGQPLRYSHANMKLKEEERNRNLSELPNSETERHTGVVVSIMPSGKGGLIVPDRLNFGALGYSSTEIQATGGQRLDRFSEVEFYARPSKYDKKDRGVCITRRGGGLITAERRNTGHSRRLLGGMYSANDIAATIPKDFQDNRRRGYIANYSREKLYGFIIALDTPSSSGYFVHIDDCHIYGCRFLKRFQEVEFSVVTDQQSGKSKALHISGPNKTVIRSISENRYLPTNLTLNQLAIDDNKRYRGTVMVTQRETNWFLIKPDDAGYEPVIAFKNDLLSLGSKRIGLDDALEFTVNEANENVSSKLLRASNVTAYGGYPILVETGPLGKYLQTKIHLDTIRQSELPEYNINDYGMNMDDIILNGFIVNYNPNKKSGQIEIESSDRDVRYRKVYYKLDDCQLPDNSNINLDRIFIREGNKIQFKLKTIDYNNEFQDLTKRRINPPKSDATDATGDGDNIQQDIQYEDIEPIFHLKAVNVVSDGLDFFDISERDQPTQFTRVDDQTIRLNNDIDNNNDDDNDKFDYDVSSPQRQQRQQQQQPQRNKQYNQTQQQQQSFRLNINDDDDDNKFNINNNNNKFNIGDDDDEEPLFNLDDDDDDDLK